MDQFGVQKSALKAIARTPVLPEVKSSKKTAKSTRSEKVHQWLGAEIKNIIGLGEISATGLHDETGAWVMKVPAGSIAEKIGLKESDVILQWNGKKIDTVNDLLAASKKSESGKQVTAVVFRSQHDVTLTIDTKAMNGN